MSSWSSTLRRWTELISESGSARDVVKRLGRDDGDVTAFIRQEYPYYKGSDENGLCYGSLLLHYACCKARDRDVMETMCSRLDVDEQRAVTRFINALIRHANVTERNLLNAMRAAETEAEDGGGVATTSTPVRAAVAQTPHAIKSRRVFHLEAELDAERFDRNFLQEETARLQTRIAELENIQKSHLNEIHRLRDESTHNEKRGAQIDEACDECRHKDKRLQEQLRCHELEILRFISSTVTLEEERDSLKIRFDKIDKDLSQWQSRAIEVENELESLKVQLEGKNSETLGLKISLSEALARLDEFKPKQNMNGSVECDDDTFSIKRMLNASLNRTPENLAKAVIDIQLKEQIDKNSKLTEMLELNKKEKKAMGEKIQKLTNDFKEVEKKKQKLIKKNQEFASKIEVITDTQRKQTQELEHDIEKKSALNEELTMEINRVKLLYNQNTAALNLEVENKVKLHKQAQEMEKQIDQMKVAIIAKSKEVNGLSEIITEVKSSLENSEKIIIEKDFTIGELWKKQTETERLIECQKDKILNLENEYCTNQYEIEKLNKEVSGYKYNISKISSDLDENKKLLGEKRNELEAVIKEKSDLLKLVSSLELNIKEYKTNLQSYENKLQNYAQEVELRDRQFKIVCDDVAKYKNLLDVYKTNEEKLKLIIANNEDVHVQLTAENEKFLNLIQAYEEEINGKNNEENKIKEELNEKSCKITSLSNEMLKLNCMLEENEKLLDCKVNECNRLTFDLDEKNEIVKSLTLKIRALENEVNIHSTTVTELETENNDKEDKIMALSSKILEIEQQLDNGILNLGMHEQVLASKAKELDCLLSDKNEIQKALEARTLELEKQTKNLSEKQLELNQIQILLKNKSDIVDLLNDKLNTFESEKHELTTVLNELQTESKQSYEKILALETTINKMSDYDQLVLENKDLQENLKVHECKVEEYAVSIRDKDVELKVVKKELQCKTQSLCESELNLNALQQTNALLTHNLKEAILQNECSLSDRKLEQNQLCELKNELEIQNEKLNSLTAQLKDRDQIALENVEMKKSIDILKTEIKNGTKTRLEHESKINSINNEVQNKNKELDVLKSSLITAKSHKKEVQNNLAATLALNKQTLCEKADIETQLIKTKMELQTRDEKLILLEKTLSMQSNYDQLIIDGQEMQKKIKDQFVEIEERLCILSEKESQLESANMQINEKDNELKKLLDLSSLLETQNEALKNKSISLMAENTELRNEISDFQFQTADYIEVSKDQKHEISRLQNELTKVNTNYSILLSENKNLQSVLDMQNIKIEEFTQKLKDKQSELESIEQELGNQIVTIQVLKYDNDLFENKKREWEIVLERLTLENDNFSKKCQEYEFEIKSLKSLITNKEERNLVLEDNLSRMSNYEQLILENQNQAHEIEKTTQTLCEMQCEVETYKENLIEKTKSLEILQSEIQTLTSQKQELENNISDVATKNGDVINKILEYEFELRELKDALHLKHEKIVTLEEYQTKTLDYDQIVLTNEELQSKSESQIIQIEKYRADLNEREKSIELIKNEFTEKTEAYEKLLVSYNEMENRLSLVSKKNQEILNNQLVLEEEVNTLKGKLMLQEENIRSSELAVVKVNEYDKLLQENEKMVNTIQSQSKDLHTYIKNNSERECEVISVKEDIKKKNHDIEILKQNVEKLRILNVESEKSLSQNIFDLNSKLKSTLSENEGLSNKLSGLRKVLQEVERKNNHLSNDNTELKYQNNILKEKLSDADMRIHTENKPLRDFDNLLQDKVKLVGELKKKETEIEQLKNRNETSRFVIELRNEYEDKLTRMKQKMKQLYQEQIAVYTEKQKDEAEMRDNKHREEITSLEMICRKYASKIERYEVHVNTLSSELWRIGEKLVMLKQDRDLLKDKLRKLNGSHQSLNSMSSNASKTKVKHMESKFEDVGSTFNFDDITFKMPDPVKVESGGLHVSDEEGEVFDNRYLNELKTGFDVKLANSTMNRSSIFQPDRLSELRWRNSLQLPHLKSSYPAETQFQKFREEDIKMTNMNFDESLPKGGRHKKEAGQTSYKKPGPPTPSKKGGRVSLQGNDSREPLKEQNDNFSKKTSTPSRFRGLFKSNTPKSTSRDENTLPSTPKSRLSIFRRPR